MENQNFNQDDTGTIIPTQPQSSWGILKFLIPALVVALIVCGSVLYMQRRQNQVISVSPVVVQNNEQRGGLKTYKSDIGFSFQYPFDFSINESVSAIDDAGYKTSNPYEVVIQVENKQGTGIVSIYKWDSFDKFQQPMEGSPFLGDGSKRYGSLGEYAADYKMPSVMVGGGLKGMHFQMIMGRGATVSWLCRVLMVRYTI